MAWIYFTVPLALLGAAFAIVPVLVGMVLQHRAELQQEQEALTTPSVGSLEGEATLHRRAA